MLHSRSQRPLGIAFRFLVLLTLAGCAGPVTDNVGIEFRKRWIAAHTDYSERSSPFDGINSESARNQFIDEYLVIKDLQFHNYVTAIRRGSSYGELTADASRLILDSLAAVTGTATVKSGLAAASAGITGFTGAVKKDVLFDQALPIFIDKMVGLRAAKRADIVTKKSLDLSEYPPSEAYADVEEYGTLGTFDSALRAINIETGQATGEAKAALADRNGDEVTAEVTRAHVQLEGRIARKVVSVPVRPTPSIENVLDANKLRGDISKLDEVGAKAMLDAGRQYAILKPEFDAEPQGTTSARSYLFHLIDVAAHKDDKQAELKAWRAIIPARPATTGMPVPVEPALPDTKPK